MLLLRWMRRYGCPLLLLAILAVALRSGRAQPSPAAAVLDRLSETERRRDSTVRSYEVESHYLLAGDRFSQRAEMRARVIYTQPGGKKFQILSRTGSSFLQKRVFARFIEGELEAASDGMREQVALTPRNYDFHYSGFDTAEGRPCHTFEIRPKKRSKFLVEGRAWVDAADDAIVRVEGRPAGSHSFWIRNVRIVQRYRKVGDFWLLSSSEIDSDVRMFGPARLAIQYENYVINPRLLARTPVTAHFPQPAPRVVVRMRQR